MENILERYRKHLGILTEEVIEGYTFQRYHVINNIGGLLTLPRTMSNMELHYMILYNLRRISPHMLRDLEMEELFHRSFPLRIYLCEIHYRLTNDKHIREI